MPEGHTIHRLAREHESLFTGTPVRVSSPQGRFAEGAAQVDGRTFVRAEAVGKHLFHHYDNERVVHVHLGLYGKFATGLGPAPQPVGELRMRMENARHFVDLRGAMTCEVVVPDQRDEIVARLGPDPLRKDGTVDRAWARVGRSRAPVALLLMDQTVAAGVGNVYRAEVLYRAGLDPHRVGRDVDPEAFTELWADLRRLMRLGVRTGRIVTTVPADRERTSGHARLEDAHYVYRRAGLPCRRCGTEIRTEVLSQRNLFWCPTCQRG